MPRPRGSKDTKPRKKRGEKTEANGAAGTPQASAGPGHNSGATTEQLSEDQHRALFIQSVTKIERLREDVASASGTLRAAYKVAKAEGFSKKDIDFAIGLRKGDQAEAIERRRREQMIAKWVNHPIGTQADLFDEDRTPLDDKAFEAGKLVGMEGNEACKPPTHYPTSVAQRWIEGWHEGQAARMSNFKKMDMPASSTPIADAEAFDDALPNAEDAPLATADGEPADQHSAEQRQTFGEAIRAAQPDFDKPIGASDAGPIPEFLKREPVQA